MLAKWWSGIHFFSVKNDPLATQTIAMMLRQCFVYVLRKNFKSWLFLQITEANITKNNLTRTRIISLVSFIIRDLEEGRAFFDKTKRHPKNVVSRILVNRKYHLYLLHTAYIMYSHPCIRKLVDHIILRVYLHKRRRNAAEIVCISLWFIKAHEYNFHAILNAYSS